METYVMESLSNDLTGTRIVSDKPISVFSNHECSFVPNSIGFCDHLTEQVPPTVTWGRFFLAASFLGRTSGEIYRILSATDATDVTMNCTAIPEPLSFTLSNAGDWEELSINDNNFCSIESNNAVLVFEFSFGENADGVGGPFMTMIPPVEQYSNNYVFSVLSNFSTNFITVHVASEFFQPDRIFVDNMSLETSSFTEVYCTDSVICGFITRVPLLPGEHRLFHQDADARIGITVYGFNSRSSYGYPGGLRLMAIQGLPTIDTIPDQSALIGSDVTFTCVPISSSGPVTFSWTKDTVILSDGTQIMGSTTDTLTILNIMVADGGEYSCSTTDGGGTAASNRAILTIQLPISFEIECNQPYVVREDLTAGKALALLVCVVAEDIISENFTVRLSTFNSLATAGDDFVPIEEFLTFGPVSDTRQCSCIEIIDDGTLESNEIFFVLLSESVSNAELQPEGNFGVQIIILDDDRGFSCQPLLIVPPSGVIKGALVKTSNCPIND